MTNNTSKDIRATKNKGITSAIERTKDHTILINEVDLLSSS